jgi:hypothetical protein
MALLHFAFTQFRNVAMDRIMHPARLRVAGPWHRIKNITYLEQVRD